MAKKPQTLGGATANVDEKFQAEEDGRALSRAQEIRLDSKRHQKALKHMAKSASDIQATVDREQKAKKGLAEAFPPDKEAC